MLRAPEIAPAGPSPVNEFATGGQEPANVVLSDGTLVRLAGLSRLRVPTAEVREVSLAGRAYFAVTTDPGRPFTVHTTIGDVRVLGTRFALEASEEDLRLVVVEGSVALVIDGAETVVHANQMARHVRGTTLPTVEVPSTLQLAEWVGRFLAFRDTPLREVVQQVGEMYGIAIDMDPSLANKTLTAWFADWTLEEVVEAVCMVASAECEVTEDLVTIAPQ
jgi:ferric-dicitrate binding protein FerR (iron transport regulator)